MTASGHAVVHGADLHLFAAFRLSSEAHADSDNDADANTDRDSDKHDDKSNTKASGLACSITRCLSSAVVGAKNCQATRISSTTAAGVGGTFVAQICIGHSGHHEYEKTSV